MNISRAQKVRLGVFLFVGTVIFFASVGAITGVQVWQKRQTFTVRFGENVSGLDVSSPVKYQGLRIGRVDDMYIAPDDPGTIEVVLALDPRTVLYEGATASLDQSGLTGLKSINISGGDPLKGKLEPGSRLVAGRSLLDVITGQAEVIALKFEIVATQLAKLTRDENLEKVEGLVSSVTGLTDEITRFLASNRGELKTFLDGMGRAGGALADLSEDGRGAINAVRDDVGKTLGEARLTLKEFRRPLEQLDPKEVADTVRAARGTFVAMEERLSSEQLGQAIVNLNKALIDVTRVLGEVDLAVRAGREDFTATLSNLRQAAEDMREFSQIIAQDPAALLRGRE